MQIEEGRDVWWHCEMEDVDAVCPPEPLEASTRFSFSTPRGSTGKPKGILHTTAGYLLGAYLSCKYVFDLRDEDVYWCTADIGWVTGPLLCGVWAAGHGRHFAHVRRSAELAGE